MQTRPNGLPVVLVAAMLTTECSNFQRTDEGDTLRRMITPIRWAPYDGPAPPSPRAYPSVTPTPRGSLLFGGIGASGPVGEGWLWGRGRWTPLPADGSPSARAAHAAEWVGGTLCVFGGAARGEALGDGACWCPAVNRWEALPAEGAPSPRSSMASVFTGREWILWGGRDSEGNDLADGARYDPASRRWTPLPDGGPRARHGAMAVLSPDAGQVLIWGGAGEALALGAEDSAVLDLATWTWSPMPIEGAPPARTGPVGLAVAGGVVAVGNEGAARFEWSTRRWRPIDPPPLSPRWGSAAVAREGAIVLWGGRDEAGLRNDGAVLDLTTDRWTPLSAEGSPSPRMSAVAVDDPAGVLVLWGTDGTTLRADASTLR